MNPLVSTIIPTYNRGEAMLRAIESVLEQTWRPLELVIVDDGSTDDTPQVLERMKALAEQHDVTFQSLRQENAGAPAARNTGMAAAKGDYLAHLDDDDRWYPDKLEKQMHELLKTGADLCSCFVVRNSAKGTSERMPKNHKSLLGQGSAADTISGRASAHINSLLHTRRAIEQYGDFEARLRNCFDHEFMTRIALQVKCCQVPEILATYDCRVDSLTRSNSWEKQLRKNNYRVMLVEIMRDKLNTLPQWDEDAWRIRASGVMRQIVKQYLWRLDFAGAREKLAQMHDLVGATGEYRMLKRRYLKYRVLSAIGFPVKKDRWS